MKRLRKTNPPAPVPRDLQIPDRLEVVGLGMAGMEIRLRLVDGGENAGKVLLAGTSQEVELAGPVAQAAWDRDPAAWQRVIETILEESVARGMVAGTVEDAPSGGQP